MYYHTTNKTEESWARSDIEKLKPSKDSKEILERINKLNISAMSYETVIDFIKAQLSTWRRFYKEDDKVEVEEAWTPDNRKVTRIKSLDIVYYVRIKKDGTYKVNSGTTDTINEKYAYIFEDSANGFEALPQA